MCMPPQKEKPILKTLSGTGQSFNSLTHSKTTISRRCCCCCCCNSPMDDFKRGHVPAFGSWDCEDRDGGLPFTQCFESATQSAGFLGYAAGYSLDRDLYVAGDLYENNVVTPAMIVVPRRRARGCRSHLKEEKRRKSWDIGMKEPPSPTPPTPPHRPTPKPVDEDLYKISPDLLYSKPKKKRLLGFFTSCLLPTCVL